MKKSLLSLSLVTLVTGTFLSSCSGVVKYEDGVIVKIGDTKYTIEEAYKEFSGYKEKDSDSNYTISEEGAKNYYTLLKNILIQLAVPTTNAIEKYVDQKIENEYYQAAKDNSKSNGTSENEEREKILSNQGVENVDELRAKFLLERKTTRNTNDFYTDENYAKLTPEYIEKKSPYHVRHILVKVDAATSDIDNATISEDDANQLYNVISRLSTSETFSQVAQTASEDSSASTYGDVGIMDIDTSFVSEFKYALYGYDAYFNASSDKEAAKTRLSIPEKAESVIGTYNFGIPLSEVLKLKQYADVTKDKNNVSVERATDKNYPRNIIFSHYLNNHGTSYIYLDKEPSYYEQEFGIKVDSNKFKEVSGLSASLKEYAEVEGKSTYQNISSSKSILCDESGRPIIVTRAGTGTSDSGYQGIHFIIAQRSPFENMDKISNYYTLDIPSTSSDETPSTEATYINFVKTDDRNVYNDRADAIRSVLKTVDNNMEYRIFKDNLSKAENVTIDSKIKEIIDRYMKASEESSAASKALTYSNSWETYLELLELQQDLIGRVLPTSCISSFENGEITKGGVCDVNY